MDASKHNLNQEAILSPKADQYQLKLRWLAPKPLVAGRGYLLRYQDTFVPITVTAIKYRLSPDTQEQLSAKYLREGEIGVVNVSMGQALEADLSVLKQAQVLDSNTFAVIADVWIDFPLMRATNLRWQQLCINKQARASQKQQQPTCLWFTGLSGSGKSTLANLLEQKLFEQGKHTYLLDGDNLRHGLNRDLGFTEADRVENIRRVIEVARLMVDAGLIVITSFISPFQAERQLARRLFAPGEFIEIYVNTPLHECEKRDVKGLYAKARRGEIKNFTGIDSVYEPPENPELIMDTCVHSSESCVEQIIDYLQAVSLRSNV